MPARRGIVSGVSGRYIPWLWVPLQHGPWIAALAAAAVTPGGLWLLALPLEHRLMGFRTGFLAVLLGDPLLALAVALGDVSDGCGAAWRRARNSSRASGSKEMTTISPTKGGK